MNLKYGSLRATSCLAVYFTWPQVALTHHVFSHALIRPTVQGCQDAKPQNLTTGLTALLMNNCELGLSCRQTKFRPAGHAEPAPQPHPSPVQPATCYSRRELAHGALTNPSIRRDDDEQPIHQTITTLSGFTKNQRMPHPLAVGMNLSSRWGFQRGRSTPLVKGGVNAPPAKARRAARVLRCRRVY